MITFAKNKDLFDLDVDTLVNPVNTIGVMGAGLALKFKRKFPTNYKMYLSACRNHTLSKPGDIFITSPEFNFGLYYIVNMATKGHWKNPSKLEYITVGLANLAEAINSNKSIQSIAIPAIGCGLGGLEWSQVKEEIEYALDELSNSRNITVIEPF